jgi:hypothetical protein
MNSKNGKCSCNQMPRKQARFASKKMMELSAGIETWEERGSIIKAELSLRRLGRDRNSKSIASF